MDTRKTIKTGSAQTGRNTADGAGSATRQTSSRKLARERLAPELDRYLLRLGLTGLFDGGTSK
jgi:hypothetical protein